MNNNVQRLGLGCKRSKEVKIRSGSLNHVHYSSINKIYTVEAITKQQINEIRQK